MTDNPGGRLTAVIVPTACVLQAGNIGRVQLSTGQQFHNHEGSISTSGLWPAELLLWKATINPARFSARRVGW